MGGEIATAGIEISILVSQSEYIHTIFTDDKSKWGSECLTKECCSKLSSSPRCMYVRSQKSPYDTANLGA